MGGTARHISASYKRKYNITRERERIEYGWIWVDSIVAAQTPLQKAEKIDSGGVRIFFFPPFSVVLNTQTEKFCWGFNPIYLPRNVENIWGIQIALENRSKQGGQAAKIINKDMNGSQGILGIHFQTNVQKKRKQEPSPGELRCAFCFDIFSPLIHCFD